MMEGRHDQNEIVVAECILEEMFEMVDLFDSIASNSQ